MRFSRLTLAIAGLISVTSAHADGIERSTQPVGILFEDGNKVELSHSYVNPNIKAKNIAGQDISGMIKPYHSTEFGVKADFNDNTSVAVLYSQPWGADIKYPKNDVFKELTAKVESSSVSVLGSHTLEDTGFTVFGGVDVQGISADIKDPTKNYEFKIANTTAPNPVMGVAYEIPEIMFRSSLTYRPAVKFKADITQKASGGQLTQTDKDVALELPQALDFSLQTGLSEKYQLLGTMDLRWVEWSKFNVTAPALKRGSQVVVPANTLVSYDKDQLSVNLGLGKQFTNKFAGKVGVSFAKGTSKETPVNAFGPYGRVTGLSFGGQYDVTANLSLSGGVQVMKINGGTYAEKHPVNNQPLATAEDTTGYAAGIKVGYNF